jgi:hypothetical protein
LEATVQSLLHAGTPTIVQFNQQMTPKESGHLFRFQQSVFTALHIAYYGDGMRRGLQAAVQDGGVTMSIDLQTGVSVIQLRHFQQ